MTGISKLLCSYSINSYVAYHTGEQMINRHTFTVTHRGVLHGLFSRHVALRDMFEWLVDIVDRPTCHGKVPETLLLRHKEPQLASIHMLLHVTDAWHSSTRLHTVITIGTMAAVVRPNCIDLDYDLLADMLPRLYKLTAKSLTTIAERSHECLVTAKVTKYTRMVTTTTYSSVL